MQTAMQTAFAMSADAAQRAFGAIDQHRFSNKFGLALLLQPLP